MTFKEAAEWTQSEFGRTLDCEDPASALYTFIGSDNLEDHNGGSLVSCNSKYLP